MFKTNKRVASIPRIVEWHEEEYNPSNKSGWIRKSYTRFGYIPEKNSIEDEKIFTSKTEIDV